MSTYLSILPNRMSTRSRQSVSIRHINFFTMTNRFKLVEPKINVKINIKDWKLKSKTFPQKNILESFFLYFYKIHEFAKIGISYGICSFRCNSRKKKTNYIWKSKIRSESKNPDYLLGLLQVGTNFQIKLKSKKYRTKPIKQIHSWILQNFCVWAIKFK